MTAEFALNGLNGCIDEALAVANIRPYVEIYPHFDILPTERGCVIMLHSLSSFQFQVKLQ